MNTINGKDIKRVFHNNKYEKGVRNEGQSKSYYQQGASKKIQGLLRQECQNLFQTNRITYRKIFGGEEMTLITSSNVGEFLSVLNFKLKDGESNVYFKEFSKHKDYIIEVKINHSQFSKSIINWGNKIKVHRGTTSNFSQQENFVVLECINRLLEIGYPPESLELEKQWRVGGFLDIWVKDKKNKSFLMIECKTYGKKYDEAKEKVLKDGDQLFGYLVQEKNTKYVCLYSSILLDKSIRFKNDIIVVDEKIEQSQNHKEAFENWMPQIFETRGLLEEGQTHYLAQFIGIRKKDLRTLTGKDSDIISKRFLEILRRNVISDKTNAFNKIFNLFLCKIVDEDKRNDNDEVLFQWKNSEKNEEVLLRLNDLYKEGMSEYLDLEISSVSEKEMENCLLKVNTEQGKNLLKNLFIKQKLYSGNEFAFKEVFDKDTFDDNCIVVKEVVKLLEEYQLKYSNKHQFLGDFFEKLLNDGIKQEAGQYFTPIPLTDFICKSLPIKEIIKEKNKNKEVNIIPHCIDFASGSGHFLTAIMEEINYHIEAIQLSDINGGKRAKDIFSSLKNNYRWAKEYIYGIEKDYRLSKTTKINTFLNGDGDANIICGDGLDNFHKSKVYKGLLKTNSQSKDNLHFDILVSNPPYSVDGFKTTIKDGKESFDLFSDLTDKSNEIEILFLERAKQLLKEGGVAGIILPDSFFIGSIYKKARDLLLLNFDIKGILELKEGAFMETTKNTHILFLQKKEKNKEKIEKIIEQFFINFKDVSYNNCNNIFYEYSDLIYGIKLNDYISFFKETDLNKLKENILYLSYEESFDENADLISIKNSVIEIEKAKLFYFLLSHNQKVIFANTGENEKEFLGYEFRGGKTKSIRVFRDKYNDNQNTSKLYNEKENLDKTRLNYYIYKNFLNDLKNIEIDKSLKDNVQIKSLYELFKFDKNNFDNQIISKPTLKIISSYRQEPLFKHYKIVDSGTNAPQDNIYFKNGKYPFIRAGNLNKKDKNNIIIPDKNSLINDLALKDHRLKKFPKGTILFAKTGRSSTKNNIGVLKDESYVVNHLAVIYDENKLNLEFLYYYLEFFETSNLIPAQSDYPTISLTDIRKLKIPIVPKTIKEKIVKDLKKIDENNKSDKLQEKRTYLSKYFKKEYI